MKLTVNVDRKGEGAFVAFLSGSLDTITYKELEKTIEPFLVPATKVLIFNMEGLTYISSMGISVLIKTKKAIEEQGGSFIMTNLQPQIKVVFEVIKALPNMRVFESIEEADEYLSQIQRKEIERRQGEAL